jgi:hypothetical protein
MQLSVPSDCCLIFILRLLIRMEVAVAQLGFSVGKATQFHCAAT